MEHDYKALWEYAYKENEKHKAQIAEAEEIIHEKDAACDKLEEALRDKDAEISDLNDTINDNAEFTSYLSGQLIAYRHVLDLMFRRDGK